MNRRNLAVLIATASLVSLTACGVDVDTSSAQSAAASAMRLAAEGKAEDACDFAVTDWSSDGPGVRGDDTHWIYARYTESIQVHKDSCIESFEQFSRDLDAAGATDEISHISAEDLALGASDSTFTEVYHETLGVSVEVVRLEGSWYVYGHSNHLNAS